MTENNNATKPQGEHAGGIPKPLRERDQWIATNDKGPIYPSEGWNNPDVQLAFHQAQRVAKQRVGEVAYVLNAEDPFTIVDFDNVGSHGSFSDEAEQIVEDLDTYTEISRSGTGLHAVCRGTRLPDRQVKGVLDNQGEIEVYDANQYVVLTGNQFKEYGVIASDMAPTGDDRHPLLDIQRRYLAKRDGPVEPDSSIPPFDLTDVSDSSAGIDVQEIYRTLEEFDKGGSSKAGEIQDQWQSQSGSNLQFPSGSEADLSFVSNLAFWCREDAKLIDRCFRQSKRMRAKWDEVRYSDGRTYGEGTIQLAIRSNYDTFSGHYVTK